MGCIHQYEVVFSEQNAVVEKCKKCKKKYVARHGQDGRINNKEYAKEHIGDLAQPDGRTGKIFRKLYGEPERRQQKIKQVLARENERIDAEYEEEIADIRRKDWSSNNKYLNPGV